MENILTGTSQVLTGNSISKIIAVNRGTLRVVGNNCHIIVLCNLGVVVCTGNDGSISIGSSTSQTQLENVKGQISVTGNNMQITVGNTSYVQTLQLVGTGLLHLPSKTHVLNGYNKIKIKGGRVKTPVTRKVNSSTKTSDGRSASVSSRCSLYINSMSGVYIGSTTTSTIPRFPITRKSFGL